MLFLDYDGTLTPLARHPEMATPAPDLIDLLVKLSSDARNSVIVTSGRGRVTLDEWFNAPAIGLVAEHGAWWKPAGRCWTRATMPQSDWKAEILTVLEIYSDRLPGSFIEEKEESLAWHYRMADPEQGQMRASELVDHLVKLTGQSDLQVVQGHKVVETRRAGVDKGTAAGRFLAGALPDFILAAGDDVTDEDMFRALPATAITIRVGMASTQASYNLRHCSDLLDLLRALV
jgi:trehalose 6-phosphate synthase/phosphatase